MAAYIGSLIAPLYPPPAIVPPCSYVPSQYRFFPQLSKLFRRVASATFYCTRYLASFDDLFFYEFDSFDDLLFYESSTTYSVDKFRRETRSSGSSREIS